MSGYTGMLGRALNRYLASKGHHILGISRNKGPERCQWDPAAQSIESAKLSDTDVYINLAGEPISQRWSTSVKQAILRSRLDSTRLLVDTILQNKLQPKVFLSASAIGYYGIQRNGVVDEDSQQGDGFLADVCLKWEAETQRLRDAGIRVVNMRIGVVLDPSGGALAKVLPIFKMGMGGPVGSGKQQMSWISLHDVCRSFEFCMLKDSLSGAVNIVAQKSVTNAQFAKALGSALSRPACIPTPAIMVKAMFGQMAQETILSDVSAKPRRLLDAGFEFKHEALGDWMLEKALE